MSMQRLAILLSLFLCSQNNLVLAQSTPAVRSESIRVESDEQLPSHARYLYPQFSQGTVHLRNGQTATARLNYQLQLREIQFLNPKGDTLTLANTGTVRRIELNKDTFVYDQNGQALQVLGDYGPVALAQHHSLQVANVEKEVAFRQSSSLSSVTNYSTYPTATGSIAQLEMKGDVVYSRRRVLYLINQNGLAAPPSRKAVLKLFSGHKTEIDRYLRDQPVQFNLAEDLQRLLEFCAGLK